MILETEYLYLKAMRQDDFNDLGLSKVYSIIKHDNIAS